MEMKAKAAAFDRMMKDPKSYRWVDLSSSGRRNIIVEVGLASESGLYPYVNLVFSSVAEIEELINTLRGVANAQKRNWKRKK